MLDDARTVITCANFTKRSKQHNIICALFVCTKCVCCCIKVSCTGADGEELKGKIWRHYKKQYYIIALHWLASHFVVAMDTSERMHLIHVPNGQEYQVG